MSKIEWTDVTYNPVTGCDRVSPGCDNCYAARMAGRLKTMGQPKYQTDGRPETSGPGFGVQTHPDVLTQPLRWRKPRRVFVCSMSDLFHPQVPPKFIAAVYAVMALAGQHQFQVLTKRPQRARALLGKPTFRDDVAAAMRDPAIGGMDAATAEVTDWPLANVWLGVSVEDQERADQRIPLLLDTPAAVRFVSAEPLLGPVDLHPRPPDQQHLCIRCGHGPDAPHDHPDGYRTRGIDWVIVGGESGPGARLMHPAWAHQLVRQCQQAGVAVFVKQLGSHFGRDHHDLDAFPPDLQVRQYPDEVEVPA